MVELYDIDLELAEIDENLIREKLTALDRAEQLERRKWIYEQKFPETKKGGSPNQSDNLSFSEDTAEKVGQTARNIQRDVAIAKGIPQSLRDDIRGTDMEDSREDLRAPAHERLCRAFSGEGRGRFVRPGLFRGARRLTSNQHTERHRSRQ